MYRYILIDSVKYGHIIDPRTGYGLAIRRTVTVQTDNCTDADALASILSVWGVEEGFKIISSIPGAKAIIIQENEGVIECYKKGELNYIK